MRKTAAGLLLFAAAAASGVAADLSLSLKAGVFFPSQKAFRTVYGHGFPLGLDVRLSIIGPYGFLAGYESSSLDGSAVSLDGGDDILPLKFKSRSLRMGTFGLISVGPAVLAVSGGAVRCAFEETWTTVPGLDYRDSAWGLFAAFAVETPITGRIGATAEIRYEALSSGSGGLLEQKVSLGGFHAAAGFSVRIF